MTALSTSAWVIHDLGLATSFGGPLFGKVALQRAVKDISSPEERSQVLQDAWQTFNVIDAFALGAIALPWLVGRTAISGRSIDRTTRALVLAKDVCVGGAVVTGIANFVANKVLENERPYAQTAGDGESSTGAEPKVSALMRVFKVAGPLNLAFVGGAIAVTAALAMKSGRSTKWSFLSRLLP